MPDEQTSELLQSLILADSADLAEVREFMAVAAVAAVARAFGPTMRAFALASKSGDEADRRAQLTITLDISRPSDWVIGGWWKATYPAAVKGELPERAMNQPDLPGTEEA